MKGQEVLRLKARWIQRRGSVLCGGCPQRSCSGDASSTGVEPDPETPYPQRVATVQERANQAGEDGTFLGGPLQHFERVGRLQLATLLQQGLSPYSRVLDVGCGALRGGYWLLHFLEPNRYYGIEPNKAMLQIGLDRILEPGLEDQARPTFAHNDDFDFTVFGVRFDYVLARSVWTHASKSQIETMLDSFNQVAAPGGVMLTSYLPTGLRPWKDYKGAGWVGRSHESGEAGIVRHKPGWITSVCRARGFTVRELPGKTLGQVWLRIERV
jgi:SAM-dependent methyltransferase